MMLGMRATHIVFLTVLISHASFASELDTLELVQELEDPDASAQISYAAIQGFAIKDGATSVPGKDNAGCAGVCTMEPSCRSYSYSPNEKVCMWSTESLNFDPNFVLKTKAHHSSSPTKEYRTFEGMTYKAKGWLKVTGKSLEECTDLCTQSTSCEALSYREDDMLCLLSPQGVHYSADFTYYEKKGQTMNTMPVTKEGGAKMPSEEEVDDTEKKDNEAEVQALMNAEQAKLSAADQEIADAKKMEADSKSAVSKEESEMHADIAKAKADAAANLEKQENEFASEQAEKMSQEESTLKLQFASAALKEKAAQEEAEAEREKERTQEAAADVKEHAAREAGRAVAEGAEEAAQRVEKAQLEQKSTQAQQEMTEAEQEAAKADLEKQNAVDEVEATKEVAEKKSDQAEKEIDEKKAALEGKSEVEREAGMREIQEARDRAEREAQQRGVEIEQMEERRSSERAEKAKEDIENQRKENEQVVREANDERVAEKNAKDAEDEKLTQMEKQAMLAKVEANKMQVNSQIAGEEEKLKTAQSLSDAEMNFQKKELAEQIRAKMEREAATEVESQREQVAREAAQRVAEASKEEADRVAQEATDAVERKEIAEKDKVTLLKKKVESDKELEEAKTNQQRQEINTRIEKEKDDAETAVKKIEDDAKEEAKTIEDQAKADAKAKTDKADADAALTAAEAKAEGEKQAADIAEAAEQAALISTQTIKADEATFVSSGLNPGSENYQDLENNANSAATNAADEQAKAAAAKEAVDEANAKVTAQENKGKELSTKSATASAAANQAASTTATTAAATAAAAAASNSVAGGGRRLLSKRDELDRRLGMARARAVTTMRRLLQTSGGDIAGQVTNAVNNAVTTANQVAQAASNQGSQANQLAAATQLNANANAAATASSESQQKGTAATAASAAAAESEEARNKAEAKSGEMDSKAAANAAQKANDEAQAAAETQQAALNAANLLPANTAYGKLPEMFEHKGYLRVQSGGPMEQSVYMKFPVTGIKATDTIIGATMRLYKTGGGGGPAMVKLASCAWTRNTLTYTSSEALPQQTASEGVTAVFPEESDMWASIQLRPALIQSARANGDHICFEVTGGPKDEPAVVSSELTSKQPELRIELQSPPKTQEEKDAQAAQAAALAQKLKVENDMEEHLKAKYTAQEKAAALQEKAALLPGKVLELKNAAAAKETEETGGQAFQVLKAQYDAEGAGEIEQTVATKSTEITERENGDMATTLANSGKTGQERTDYEAELAASYSSKIATAIASMKTQVTDDTNAKFLNKLTEEVENKKAAIQKKLAEDVAEVTQKHSTLTAGEMGAVEAKANGGVAKGMSDWKAGQLTDPDAPASVHQAAMEQAQDGLDAGVTEEDKAKMNADIETQLQQELPQALTEKVDGKMAEAEASAIAAIKTKLTEESQTQLMAAIARDTAGKTEAQSATVTQTLTAQSQQKLTDDITAATTSTALTTLQAKLRSDLEAEMKNSVETMLKAKITKSAVAKFNGEAAETAQAQAEAVASGASASAPAKELGDANTKLDKAKNFVSKH